jgi:tetratricopeptide (TPR) repeat protein
LGNEANTVIIDHESRGDGVISAYRDGLLYNISYDSPSDLAVRQAIEHILESFQFPSRSQATSALQEAYASPGAQALSAILHTQSPEDARSHLARAGMPPTVSRPTYTLHRIRTDADAESSKTENSLMPDPVSDAISDRLLQGENPECNTAALERRVHTLRKIRSPQGTLLIVARISSAAVGAAMGAALGAKISYTSLTAVGSALADTDLRYGGASLGALIGWLSLPVLIFLSVSVASILLFLFGAQLSGESTVRLGVVILVVGGILELYRTYMILIEQNLILGQRTFIYVIVGILSWTMIWAPRERKDLLDRLSARLNLPRLQKQLRQAILAHSLLEIVSIRESIVTSFEAIYGPDHPALIDPLLSLGLSCQESGIPKALLHYRRALSTAEKHLPPNDPKIAVIVTNIGSIYRRMGEPEKARECYLKAIEIDRLAYGEWHLEYATDVNNLAVTYMDERKFDEARPWLEKALEIDLRVYGPGHYVVAQDYQNWAGILQADGDLQEAKGVCQQALAILETQWPHLTLRIAHVLISLAGIEADLSNYAGAVQLIERVLQLDRKALGKHHIDIGNDLLMLAIFEAHPLQSYARLVWNWLIKYFPFHLSVANRPLRYKSTVWIN